MARNVMKAGFPLVVHNRSQGAVSELVSEGASSAPTPAALAARVDVVCTCLPGPADVAKVYLEENGILAGARPGTILIDLSTIDPATHRRIAALAADQGLAYLDAPVSGGTSGAKQGTLTIMVGGPKETIEQATPVLQAMGQRIYHLGPVGSGAVAKLVNQLMGNVAMAGVIEGMVLATKFGLDPRLVYEVVGNSSGASRSLGSVPAILKGDFEPGFTIDLMHKDVALAVDLGRQLQVRTLAGALAQQLLQEAQGLGLGRSGTAAEILPLERQAGVEVRSKAE
jgi:3-hydroxyisobutyrate dehydrogenase-like beta-hydroxyacid dehydrogenase